MRFTVGIELGFGSKNLKYISFTYAVTTYLSHLVCFYRLSTLEATLISATSGTVLTLILAEMTVFQLVDISADLERNDGRTSLYGG